MHRSDLHSSIAHIPMPDRMKSLPLTAAGFPALYFAGLNAKRELDLRVMDAAKYMHCFRNNRCFLCGQPLGKFLTWPIGPMCVVNRVSSEPPSHLECSEYAMVACPFLTRPHAKRRTNDLPNERYVAGIHVDRNPGCSALWVAKSYKLMRVDTDPAIGAQGGVLVNLGPPIRVTWHTQGRLATRAEVEHSLKAGLPKLYDVATKQGPESIGLLKLAIADAMKWLPDE